MKKIITTVGTSLFTNYNSDEIKNLIGEENYKPIADELKKLKNISAKYYSEAKYKNDIEDIKNIIKKKWLSGFAKKDNEWIEVEKTEFNYDASAEIKSIFEIIRYNKKENEFKLLFLSSDTILSKLASELISAFFEEISLGKKKIYSIETKTINGLTVFNKKEFIQTGLKNLIDELDNNYKAHNKNIILNVTGGYKGVIPYLTIWGQINGIDIFYIYEESNQLIKIPQIPISVDYKIIEKYYDKLKLFIENQNVIAKSKDVFLQENELYVDDFLQDIIIEEFDRNYSLISLDPLAYILLKKYELQPVILFPKKSKYFDEDPSRKGELNKAINDLLRKLLSIENINTLTDKILKHTVIDDTYVYKYAHKNVQYRIQYKWINNKELIVFNYAYISSQSDDKNYSTLLSNEYNKLKKSQLIKITI